MKKLFLLALALGAFIWSSVALALVVPPGFTGTYTGLAGYQTWASSTGKLATAGEAVFMAAAGGGLNAATAVAPLLRDGRVVAMTVTRLASGAALFSALKALTGPIGISLVLLEAMPAILTWIDGDGGVHIRRALASATGLEINVVSSIRSFSCIYPNTHILTGSMAYLASQCALETSANLRSRGYPNCTVIGSFSGFVISQSVEESCGYNYQSPTTTQPVSESSSWLPASMDDIAPYMTPRSPPTTFPDQLMRAGGSIDVTPVSLVPTGLPLAEPAPYVHTTTYPKPADQTTRGQTLGNPWGLPANTPSVTASATSSRIVSPGSRSSTGTNTNAVPLVGDITVPTTSTTTSTFDPVTNQTTSDTVVKTDAAQVVSTTISTTTNVITNNNTSTITNNYTTTNVFTNMTKNEPLKDPVVTTDTKPAEPVADQCKADPTLLVCAKLGDPPTPEKMTNTKKDVVITPVTFASSSSCPAPLTFAVASHTYSVSYNSLCDKLAALKYLFLAMAGFIAAWTLASVFKV